MVVRLSYAKSKGAEQCLEDGLLLFHSSRAVAWMPKRLTSNYADNVPMQDLTSVPTFWINQAWINLRLM